MIEYLSYKLHICKCCCVDIANVCIFVVQINTEIIWQKQME